MIDLVLPTSLVLGLLVWFLVARWYLLPWARQRPLAEALRPLLLLHGLRYVGLAFLVTGVTAAPLDPRFAEPAAWGDLVAALLALAALGALQYRLAAARTLVWVFNLFGALDLLAAVALGLRFTPDGDLGATFFIPALLVPPLLVSHGLIGWLMLRSRRAGWPASPESAQG